MQIMIALPGDKYYSLPVEVLEKYAVAQSDFEQELSTKESILDDDVVGQSDDDRRRGGYAALGIRG